MSCLARLHEAIEQRVGAIRTARPDWLCGKGCDACCRQLAALPRLTRAEWELLREGLAALPPDRLADIQHRLEALGEQPPRPVTCPLLDPVSGACPVYVYRPIACRTYGFYRQRDKGLYCQKIEAQETTGALDEIVWGNHEAIEQALSAFGESRSLSDWLALSPGAGDTHAAA